MSDNICPECLNGDTRKDISSDRILIVQNSAKEGIIEIRPGLEDVNLGDKKYAMVHIYVGPSNNYIYGMALYSDDIPEDYDIVFYTRLKSDGNFVGYKKGTRTRKTPGFIIMRPDYEDGNWKDWEENNRVKLAYKMLRSYEKDV